MFVVDERLKRGIVCFLAGYRTVLLKRRDDVLLSYDIYLRRNEYVDKWIHRTDVDKDEETTMTQKIDRAKVGILT